MSITMYGQLSALARAYGLQFNKLYHDKRVRCSRFKFHNVNTTMETTRWFYLRLQTEYPGATINLYRRGYNRFYDVWNIEVVFPIHPLVGTKVIGTVKTTKGVSELTKLSKPAIEKMRAEVELTLPWAWENNPLNPINKAEVSK